MSARDATTDPMDWNLEGRYPWLTRSAIFLTQFLARRPPPRQGWKLHISATPFSAEQVLARTLDILDENGVSWKAVRSQRELLLLNNGVYGFSQIGKFLTVYPETAQQAVDLARKIDRATNGLPGPRILSDRRLNPTSVVHYRFGTIVELYDGRDSAEARYLRGSLVDREGYLHDDIRGIAYNGPPPGIVDPFEQAGLYIAASVRPPPLANRFLITKALGNSSCGGIFQAIDLKSDPPQFCVIKEFRQWAGGELDQSFAPDWGRQEAKLLQRHEVAWSIPCFIDEFDMDENVYLVLEYVEGTPLSVLNSQGNGQEISYSFLIMLGMSLARSLEDLHSRGVISRDITPSNIIIQQDNSCRIIDFGSAADLNYPLDAPRGRGTFAYCSPQQWAGGAPDARDDIYAWGAVMYELAAKKSAKSSDAAPSAGYDADLANIPERLSALIIKALSDEPSKRPSIETTISTLRTIPNPYRTITALPRLSAAPIEAEITKEEALKIAVRIGERLCASAIDVDGGKCWETFADETRFVSADFYHGAAGIAVFLAKLSVMSGRSDFRVVAQDATRWIAGSAWMQPRALQGLYVGETGIGWSYLLLSDIFSCKSYVTAASIQWDRIAAAEMREIDVSAGLAGRLIFLSRLASKTSKSIHIEAARHVAKGVMDHIEPKLERTALKSWSESYGIAHGIGGIGSSLLEYWRLNGDARSMEIAKAIGSFLIEKAALSSSGYSGWGISPTAPEPLYFAHCHGTVGTGQFLLRLATASSSDAYMAAAIDAARATSDAVGAIEENGLCHGLAGCAGFLLECGIATKDKGAVGSANRSTTLLAQRIANVATFEKERPDLFNGLAGIGWHFLRFVDPQGGFDPVLRAVIISPRL